MADKTKACKDCGYLTAEKQCPMCSGKQFVEKYKGAVVIFDVKKSKVAEVLSIKNNGKYALKYG